MYHARIVIVGDGLETPNQRQVGVSYRYQEELPMLETIILIFLLMLVPLILQLFVITTYWHRVAGMLHRAADRPPFNTWLTLESIGPEPGAVTRLLERKTRLDIVEIDNVVLAGGGRL